MFRVIFLVLVAIILYKLIFDFIIPIYRASRDLRSRFKDMNQQMGDNMNQFGQSSNPGRERDAVKKPSDKDYIDFEEVK